MSIHVTCDHCGAGFSVKDEHAGRRGKCKKCGELVVVPAAESEPEPEGFVAADGTGEVFEEVASQVPIFAIGAAAIAAVLGSIAWAAVIYFTEYEIGYLAWAIGGAVGFGSVKFGGRGIAMGVVAAALTVVSIFGGKFVSGYVLVSEYITEEIDSQMNRDFFQEEKTVAWNFAELPDRSDETLSAFMVSHSFTEASSQAEVSAEQIQAFKANNVPWLEMMVSEKPSFGLWKPRAVERAKEAMDSILPEVVIDSVIEESHVIDLIFLGLGVATAFGMCTRGRKN